MFPPVGVVFCQVSPLHPNIASGVHGKYSWIEAVAITTNQKTVREIIIQTIMKTYKLL